MTLADVFDTTTLMGLASSRAYARGVGYHADGSVELDEATDGCLGAVVRGTMPYRVELWSDVDEPCWECGCPAAEDGSFCKHCVAVALTLAGDARSGPLDLVAPPPAETGSGGGGLLDYVAGLDHDRLVELIVAQADTDRRLRERLVAEAQASAGEGPSVEMWRRRIDRVFAPYGDFVAYREAAGWASEVGEVIDALFELGDAGHPDVVAVLAEHAHRRADEAVNYVDDSDGWLNDISSRLSELHLQACETSRPEPVALARRLVDLELTSELDGFHRAAGV